MTLGNPIGRYQQLILESNRNHDATSANQLIARIRAVPAEFGRTEFDLPEEYGLRDLAEYAKHKGNLALRKALDQSTIQELKEIEQKTFALLDEVENTADVATIKLIEANLEAQAKRLNHIASFLPKDLHFQSLPKAAQKRCGHRRSQLEAQRQAEERHKHIQEEGMQQ